MKTTIWITNKNEPHWKTETRKGALVNELLEKHYKKATAALSPQPRPKPADSDDAKQELANFEYQRKVDQMRATLNGQLPPNPTKEVIEP